MICVRPFHHRRVARRGIAGTAYTRSKGTDRVVPIKEELTAFRLMNRYKAHVQGPKGECPSGASPTDRIGSLAWSVSSRACPSSGLRLHVHVVKERARPHARPRPLHVSTCARVKLLRARSAVRL